MKLHLPSRLRRAVLVCLASVFSATPLPAAWSAAILPVGALCLFSAAQQAAADPITIGEGSYKVTGGLIGGKQWDGNSEIIFDADGTQEAEKNVLLELQEDMRVRTITVQQGTHLEVSARTGQNYGIAGEMSLYGTIEFVSTANNTAPSLSWGNNPARLNIVDENKNARIILNFNGRDSTVNGLSIESIFEADTAYSGALQLQGVMFGITSDSVKYGNIIVVGGAQFQIGRISAGTATPDHTQSIEFAPKEYVGDVYLTGSTEAMSMQGGEPGWAPKCGALRLVPGSRLNGSLILAGDANVLVVALTCNNGNSTFDVEASASVNSVSGNGHNLTLTGAGTLVVGPGENIGTLIMEDAANSGIIVSKDANGNYANRATGARFGRLEVSSSATEKEPFNVSGLVSVRHNTPDAPRVQGSGWLRLTGDSTYIFAGQVEDPAAYDAEGQKTRDGLHIQVSAKSSSMMQRFSGYLSIDTLKINQGTVDNNYFASGSGEAGTTNYNHYVSNLIMSDEDTADPNEVVGPSTVLVNTGIQLNVQRTADMSNPNSRIVVKGQVNSTPTGAPSSTRTNEAKLVLGIVGQNGNPDTVCDFSGHEMNGVIEIDAYGVLEICGDDASKRPTNGLNISVLHESGTLRSGGGGAAVLCGEDRLNLNSTSAEFGLRMKDGGVLSNAQNFISTITIEYSGDSGNVVYKMGGYGNAGRIALGGTGSGGGVYMGLVHEDTYGRLEDLGKLCIANQATLDFTWLPSMKGSKSDEPGGPDAPIFSFTPGSSGDLSFDQGADGKLGTLTFQLGSQLLGENGAARHYHISNKAITSWRQKISMSYYDAVLCGVGLDFDGYEEEGYGVGWLTVTADVTPSNIYQSTLDNNDAGAGEAWGWNTDSNVYERTAGARAVYIDKKTTINLQDTARDVVKHTRGLVIPNLVGGVNGKLEIIGDPTVYGDPNARSLVTLSNRIDEAGIRTVTEETGIKVDPSFYYHGSISITDADLAIRHVKEPETKGTATDLAPADPDSLTVIDGSLQLSGGKLLMQSGALDVRGGVAQLGEKGISFATNRASQMRITSGGATTVGGEIGFSSEEDDVELDETGKTDQYADNYSHVEMSGDSKLTLTGNATMVREGIRIGAAKIEESEATKGVLAGTVNIDGAVTTEKDVELKNVALSLQKGAKLTIEEGGNTAWEISGLSGEGKLVTDNEGKDLNLQLAGHDHVFSGDLAQYTGTMTIGANSKDYRQQFVGVMGNSAWNLTAESGSRVDFKITHNGVSTEEDNKLRMGEVTLEANSQVSFLLNFDANTLTPTAQKGFYFESLYINSTGGSGITVGQEDGVAFLAADKDDETQVKQYIGRVENWTLGKTPYEQIDLSNVLNVREGSEQLVIEGDGNMYIVGNRDTTNKFQPYANGVNAVAGATLFGFLWSNPSGSVTGDLGRAMQALSTSLGVNSVEGGTDPAAGNRLLASVAGASNAILTPALGADMQRNLRSIRNRTTTMGMDSAYEYEELSHTSFWVNAETSYIRRQSDDLLPGYKSNAYGGTLGIAHNVSTRSTIGLSISAMYQSVTSDSVDKMEADFTTAYISAFAVTQRRAWRHTFIASVGFTNAKTDRRVSWVDEGGVADGYSASGDTNGTSFGLLYELGYAIAMNDDQSTVLQPVFNLQWHNASLSSYDEEGTNAGLRVNPGDYSVVELGVGARLQMIVGESVYNRSSLLEMRALVKLYAGDEKGEANVGLLADTSGSSTKVESATEGRVGVEVGAGLSIPLENNASLFFDAGAELRASYVDFNATVGLKINF